MCIRDRITAELNPSNAPDTEIHSNLVKQPYRRISGGVFTQMLSVLNEQCRSFVQETATMEQTSLFSELSNAYEGLENALG